jgi:hypothetical protein
MVNDSSLAEYLLGLEPEFKERLEKFQKDWTSKGRDLTPGLEISEFTDFVIEKLKSGNYLNAKRVFEGIEHLLNDNNASESVQNAVVMSFLENLQNVSGWETISASSFVPFLGPKSIEYCRSLDEFWGTETPGVNKNKK